MGNATIFFCPLFGLHFYLSFRVFLAIFLVMIYSGGEISVIFGRSYFFLGNNLLTSLRMNSIHNLLFP